MKTETILLIGLLTLLAVNLGFDAFNLIIIKPIAKNINENFKYSADNAGSQKNLEVLKNINSVSTNLVFSLSAIILTLAIAINFANNLRIEIYLLKIGLFSFISYFVLFLSNLILKSDRLTTIFNHTILKQSNIVILLKILPLLVSYWSFLHYALNPRK